MTKRNQEAYRDQEEYNETSNTAAGINTPKENQGRAATDMLADFVEGTMENIEHTFDGDEGSENRRSK
ncbi:hypothetical protein [Paenibacillus mucilaginosus]|uniref:Uncharacterized protein n=3 Tax=Paenibacillus mucilaginosus TaxID=61624 RepID=H6NH34_9BACL|nr:hypothetical protein [Paenibacillus mucilaginosus]AEI40059.1 hypothetical protein KNP414_01495 [Paenibacillus mucilaginosus KNP414]AFC28712.1 hypothetical protein PM3016_1802 [Paenibacillus mucilaginosus 3016]AFH60889.1 hypothetical protein B2K_09175 [Paenibacillus mucilaginosus K02]MCG7215666.1 hypothetical protein [Paenibacillus mucilaginosus]WDM29299.1 hypothetical protein KCX80_09140 [Paenibacillus mucilaginosus]